MNRVGGNHWPFVAIEIKNACFVYMDSKGDLHTDLTACNKYCQMWQVFSTIFNREHGCDARLPILYSSTVFPHARLPANDKNNCGIYTLMVYNLHTFVFLSADTLCYHIIYAVMAYFIKKLLF